eukprot:TRINITY_DN35284_c0_g1_i1.p1 TRINITY_DN35284_c0_g1~~TRINITY_DN35284_c0_g1_i1.p1  ORF type:complete len:469 (+),score=50.43 TRINITY_DN35284_c0_g1_i1:157-1407(+)
MTISARAGIAQNVLVAARGIGLTVSPMLLGKAIGAMVWAGESQTIFAIAAILKVIAEVVIPRSTSGSTLVLSYALMGVSMSVLDLSASVLVSRVYGKDCALILLAYCGTYGAGCIIAPWVAVYLGDAAWDFLALIDLAMSVMLSFRRYVGKPRGWKDKIRGPVLAAAKLPLSSPSLTSRSDGEIESGDSTEGEAATSATAASSSRLPRRVLAAGMAFMFVGEATDTSVAAWCFTFAIKDLGYSPTVAATLPSIFYAFFTGFRLLLTFISNKFMPSAIMQASIFFGSVGAICLYLVAKAQADLLASGLSNAELSPYWLYTMGCCIALMGAGFAPLYAMVQGAVRQHGEMTSTESGFFFTSVNLGVLTGLFLPGIISLPTLDLAGAIVLLSIGASTLREFPLRRPRTLSEDAIRMATK